MAETLKNKKKMACDIPNKNLYFVDKEPMKECVICMELIGDKDRTVLKCGHEFHASCIIENVVLSNNTCPLCREEVGGKPEGRPKFTSGLMRIFIQNEFNSLKVSPYMSAFMEKMGKEKLWKKASLEERALISEEFIYMLSMFGMRLGNQVYNWIEEGDARMEAPEDMQEEIFTLPMSSYVDVGRDVAEEETDDPDMPELEDITEEEEPVNTGDVDDEDSRYTENDVHSLSSDSQFSIPSIYYGENDEEEIESINLQPLFEDIVNMSGSDVVAAWRRSFESEIEYEISEQYIYSGWVESTEYILQTMSTNNAVIDCFPHNDPGESTYFIERIRGNQWLYYNLADATIEEIMWPYGGPGARPLFSQQQAEAIFGEILRYHTEGLVS
jgi:hypothetical protein|tara:strand:+ start:742 stop:1896 length:1155 start_codon:yes stop_codon:yes gene_type:complete